jgi:site-specific DNA-methyltransferase (adenine-specific)
VSAYYADDTVTLHLGDMRELIPALGLTADLVLADPPYQETNLAWDRWPDGWPDVAATVASSLWCFGSMRMYLARSEQFAGWKLSQDVIWEKHNPTGPDADRFRRIHEYALHWYRGRWRDTHHEAQRVTTGVVYRGRVIKQGNRANAQRGTAKGGDWTDDGTRLQTSIISVRSMHHKAIHPTEKPVGLLDPLIRYACPPGGTVLDPFAGSGSTAVACRLSGRRAVLIEADEAYCERIATRLQEQMLPLAVTP